MKPKNVRIEAPQKTANGRYTCEVVATYPDGTVYVHTTSQYNSEAEAQLAARGVQAYLQQREKE